jgi:hypothetical protein
MGLKVEAVICLIGAVDRYQEHDNNKMDSATLLKGSCIFPRPIFYIRSDPKYQGVVHLS